VASSHALADKLALRRTRLHPCRVFRTLRSMVRHCGDFFVFLRCNTDHHAANFMASTKYAGMHHIGL